MPGTQARLCGARCSAVLAGTRLPVSAEPTRAHAGIAQQPSPLDDRHAHANAIGRHHREGPNGDRFKHQRRGNTRKEDRNPPTNSVGRGFVECHPFRRPRQHVSFQSRHLLVLVLCIAPPANVLYPISLQCLTKSTSASMEAIMPNSMVVAFRASKPNAVGHHRTPHKALELHDTL